MAVTASRLGSSPITMDWSNLNRKSESDTELFKSTWEHLKKRFNSNDVGFYDAPIENSLSQAQESKTLAEALLKKGTFTDCLFLGIGGSALGPITLLGALNALIEEKNPGALKFHFVENPDPIDWKSKIEKLDPESTLVCAVTKSGTTFETIAQTLLALDWLGKDRWKTHFVAITDPSKGDLRTFVNHEGLMNLSIAPSIGGRFSIFSPVGLFPAALSGLSIEQLLLGAKQVRDAMEKAPVEKNPIFILADEFIRQFQKRPIHVCMPYSTQLRLFGQWFVQLWGESLGKNGKGFTPVASIGATDQHSILQLLRDGPDDKITFFHTIDQVADPVRIPKAPVMGTKAHYAAFSLLENHTLHELLSIEQNAISLVLTKQRRPHLKVGLDRLDERSMGALFFMYSVLTAFTGALWDVNPFDQPGVEEGKIYIRDALSQKTYEEENIAVQRLRGTREQ